MSLNEKLKDLNYVDRNEWFDIIKDVCRSQSKRAVGFLAVILLLFILAGIYFLTSKYQGHDVGDMAAICFDLVICFALIWGIVNNLRFLRMVGSLDTPQQLLLQHEKRGKNDRRAALVCMLAVVAGLGGPYAFTDSSWGYWAMKAIFIALILIFFYNGIYMRPSDRDKEISERLQELINPE
jgi:peptidoglycan/LPS O-acetylase OafA/YrhL